MDADIFRPDAALLPLLPPEDRALYAIGLDTSSQPDMTMLVDIILSAGKVLESKNFRPIEMEAERDLKAREAPVSSRESAEHCQCIGNRPIAHYSSVKDWQHAGCGAAAIQKAQRCLMLQFDPWHA